MKVRDKNKNKKQYKINIYTFLYAIGCLLCLLTTPSSSYFSTQHIRNAVPCETSWTTLKYFTYLFL
jgi:hypothetical protein